MLNINGLNEHQQTIKDKRLKDAGSLWGSFPIFYQFVYTKQELSRVGKAKETIKDFKKKLEQNIGVLK